VIPVAVRSQAYVWGRSIAGTAASNPADSMNVASAMFVVCCVGSGLWDELTTHSEEVYWLCVCVIASELEASKMRQPWFELS